MKRIKLDRKAEAIKEFIRSLSGAAAGSILELDGKAVLRVVPIGAEPVNRTELKAAIKKRREESRQLNQEWAAADRAMWNKLDEGEE